MSEVQEQIGDVHNIYSSINLISRRIDFAWVSPKYDAISSFHSEGIKPVILDIFLACDLSKKTKNRCL